MNEVTWNEKLSYEEPVEINNPFIDELMSDKSRFFVSAEKETVPATPLSKVYVAVESPHPKNADEFRDVCKLYDAALNATRVEAEPLRKEAAVAELYGRDGNDGRDMARAVSSVRFRYAEMLSRYGKEHQDPKLFNKAQDVIKQIEKLDPATFRSSPELSGALVQLERGQAIDNSTVASDGYMHAAIKVLDFPRYLTNPSSDELRAARQCIALALVSNPEYTKNSIEARLPKMRSGDAAILKKVFEGAELDAARAKSAAKQKLSK